jgi:O-antigen/teichoic acid export membrane protein
MLRYFTKYLDATDYGIFGYVTAVNTFLIPVFTLSLNSYYIKEYYLAKDDQSRKELLGTITIFILIWSIILVGLFTFVGRFVFSYFSFSFSFSPYMFLTLLTNFFIAPITLTLLKYRLLSKPWSYFIVSLLQSLLLLGIGFFFVSVYPWGVYGRILGNLIGTVLLGLLSIILLLPHLRLSFNKRKLIEGLKFCLPLIPYTLIILSFDTLDRFFLERYNTDLATIGLYNVGFQYAAIISMFTLAFYKAYEPEIFKLMADNNEPAISQILIKLNFVVFGIAFLLILFSHWALNFLTNGRFVKSAGLASFLIVAFYFKSAYTMLNTVMTASSLNKQILTVSLLGLVILLGGSIIFVPINNLYGTLGIKILLYLVTFLCSYLLLKNKKVYRNYILHTYISCSILLLLSFFINR